MTKTKAKKEKPGGVATPSSNPYEHYSYTPLGIVVPPSHIIPSSLSTTKTKKG